MNVSPFLAFRIWLRRASVAQRVTTGLAVALAVALVGWLVAPGSQVGSDNLDSLGGLSRTGDGGSTGSTSTSTSTTGTGTGGTSTSTTGGVPRSGTSTGGTTGTGTGGTSGGLTRPGTSTGGTSTGGTGTTGTTGTAGTTGPQAKQCPPTVDQGTTNTTIRVAVTIISIGGAAGNGAIKVPTPAEQRNDWTWLADSVNASGGFACRKLVLDFYDVNPIDPNDAQTKCLAIAASKPFMAWDTGALNGAAGGSKIDCIPQQKIPVIANGATFNQMKKYYPYFISMGGLDVDVVHNQVQAWRQLGYLGSAKGFKKMGVLYHTCTPDPYTVMKAELAKVGVTGDKLLGYNLGCPPNNTDSPADLSQAVLTFKNAGVTTVTAADVNFGPFTKTAQQQNYKPQYVVSAQAPVSTDSTAVTSVDADNFDGALGITGSRYGEESTPGYKPTGGTAECNKIFASHGAKPVYQQGVGYGGVVCALTWLARDILNNATSLNRTSLIAGMHNIGKTDYSYPFGPSDYSAVPANSPWSKAYWRASVFHKAEAGTFLFKDPTFHPPFA